jgi:hypothetical protein
MKAKSLPAFLFSLEAAADMNLVCSLYTAIYIFITYLYLFMTMHVLLKCA